MGGWGQRKQTDEELKAETDVHDDHKVQHKPAVLLPRLGTLFLLSTAAAETAVGHARTVLHIPQIHSRRTCPCRKCTRHHTCKQQQQCVPSPYALSQLDHPFPLFFSRLLCQRPFVHSFHKTVGFSPFHMKFHPSMNFILHFTLHDIFVFQPLTSLVTSLFSLLSSLFSFLFPFRCCVFSFFTFTLTVCGL